MYKAGNDQQRHRWRQLLFSVTSSVGSSTGDDQDEPVAFSDEHQPQQSSSSSLTLDGLSAVSHKNNNNMSNHTQNTSAATSLNLSDLMESEEEDDDDNDDGVMGRTSSTLLMNSSGENSDSSGFFVLSQSSQESMEEYQQMKVKDAQRQKTAAEYFETVLQRHWNQQHEVGGLLGKRQEQHQPRGGFVKPPTNPKSSKTTKTSRKKKKDDKKKKKKEPKTRTRKTASSPKAGKTKKKTLKQKTRTTDATTNSPHANPNHNPAASSSYYSSPNNAQPPETPDTVPTSGSNHNSRNHPVPPLAPPDWQQLQQISTLLSSSDEERGKRFGRRRRQRGVNEHKLIRHRSMSQERDGDDNSPNNNNAVPARALPGSSPAAPGYRTDEDEDDEQPTAPRRKRTTSSQQQPPQEEEAEIVFKPFRHVALNATMEASVNSSKPTTEQATTTTQPTTQQQHYFNHEPYPESSSESSSSNHTPQQVHPERDESAHNAEQEQRASTTTYEDSYPLDFVEESVSEPLTPHSALPLSPERRRSGGRRLNMDMLLFRQYQQNRQSNINNINGAQYHTNNNNNNNTAGQQQQPQDENVQHVIQKLGESVSSMLAGDKSQDDEELLELLGESQDESFFTEEEEEQDEILSTTSYSDDDGVIHEEEHKSAITPPYSPPQQENLTAQWDHQQQLPVDDNEDQAPVESANGNAAQPEPLNQSPKRGAKKSRRKVRKSKRPKQSESINYNPHDNPQINKKQAKNVAKKSTKRKSKKTQPASTDKTEAPATTTKEQVSVKSPRRSNSHESSHSREEKEAMSPTHNNNNLGDIEQPSASPMQKQAYHESSPSQHKPSPHPSPLVIPSGIQNEQDNRQSGLATSPKIDGRAPVQYSKDLPGPLFSPCCKSPKKAQVQTDKLPIEDAVNDIEAPSGREGPPNVILFNEEDNEMHTQLTTSLADAPQKTKPPKGCCRSEVGSKFGYILSFYNVLLLLLVAGITIVLALNLIELPSKNSSGREDEGGALDSDDNGFSNATDAPTTAIDATSVPTTAPIASTTAPTLDYPKRAPPIRIGDGNIDWQGSFGDQGLGSAIAISKDGKIVATTSRTISSNSVRQVQVFERRPPMLGAAIDQEDEEDWQFRGPPIVSATSNDLFGFHVVLNESGDRVAIGAPNAREGLGLIYIYDFNDFLQEWSLSATFAGTKTSVSSSSSDDEVGTELGKVFDLSPSGNVLLTGEPLYSHKRGRVQLFRQETSDSLWTILDLQVPTPPRIGDEFGSSVSLADSSGRTITMAIGSVGFDTSVKDGGMVTVLEYRVPFSSSLDNIGNGITTLVGRNAPLIGINTSQGFGHRVKLSQDGSFLVASSRSSGNSILRVFRLNREISFWLDIMESSEYHANDFAVSVGDNGAFYGFFALSTPEKDGSTTGTIRMRKFEDNLWVMQQDLPIPSSRTGTADGSDDVILKIASSGNGNRVSVGIPASAVDDTETGSVNINAGRIQVYDYSAVIN